MGSKRNFLMIFRKIVVREVVEREDGKGEMGMVMHNAMHVAGEGSNFMNCTLVHSDGLTKICQRGNGDGYAQSYLILVPTATTGGRVLFSSRRTFFSTENTEGTVLEKFIQGI